MRFWAIVLPPVAVLMARKPFQALIALLLSLCLWLPGIIYAWGIVTDYKADKRMKQQVKLQHKMSKEDWKDYERQQREQEKEYERDIKNEAW